MGVTPGASRPGTRSGYRRIASQLHSSRIVLETGPVPVHGIGDLKLPFSFFLALRYLKPKRTFLSIITLISVIGVMLGVTVLILVISVMTGFEIGSSAKK